MHGPFVASDHDFAFQSPKSLLLVFCHFTEIRHHLHLKTLLLQERSDAPVRNRAAYLRARASWLLEWMMAVLAPAPLLRFLSFHASPDMLERTGANASLILAIFLFLPLLLRFVQKARRA